MLAAQRHHDEPGHKTSMGGGGMQSGNGAMSMSCSPAPDSSQDGVHDIDDEKLDVVGTSDGRDGASPLHISDGKIMTKLLQRWGPNKSNFLGISRIFRF